MTDHNHSARRRFIKTTGTLLGGSLLAGCMGQNGGGGSTDFPQEDIRILIPYGGGGYNDYTRLIAPYLSEHLPNSVSVVPENVTGGGGTVAATNTYEAEPDGYTFMAFNFEAFSAFEVLGRGNYETLNFTYFPAFADSTFAIGVRADSDLQSWEDYVAAVQNEEVTFGTIGPMSALSTVPWLTGEVTGLYPAANVLENRADFDGNSEIAAAMRRGDVDVFVNATDSLRPFVESGDVKIIFIYSTEEQFRDWSGIQTLASVDLSAEDQLASPIGKHVRCFAGPPNIPDERVQILRESITNALDDEELRQEADEAGRPIAHMDSEGARELAETYLGLWEENEDIIQSVAN